MAKLPSVKAADMQISIPKLLTVNQVAAHLQINPRTVYRMIEAGTLRAAKIGDSRRIAENDLALLIAKSFS
jgi:excisionase family DNA binding protein